MRIFTVGRTQLHRLGRMLSGSRNYYLALALASALMFSPLMLHTKAQSQKKPQSPSPGTYSIRSRSSLKMLDIDVRWRGQENGAKLIQWDANGGKNQQFVVAHACGDYYTLQARHSQKMLDVSGGSREDGAPLHQWEYTGFDNQQFQIEPDGDYFRIKARHSDKYLDVQSASNDNGAQIVQATSNRRDSQQFIFTRVE